MGSKSLASLLFVLGADIKDFQTKMRRAENTMQKVGKKMQSIGKGMSMAVTAPLAAIGVGSVIAFDKQAQAVNRLATQLKMNGKDVDTVLPQYKAFASELQKVTTVGDETTLGLMQMAETMGSSNAPKASKDAIGLSKALGVDLKSAIKMVTLAEKGEYTMLNRYVPALRSAKTETEKAAIAQKLFADGFELAKTEAQTGLGPMKQLKNTIGDISEKFGKIISEAINPLVARLKVLAERFDNISPRAKKIIVIIAGIVAAIGPLLIILGTLMTTVIPGLIAGFTKLTVVIAANPFGAIAVAVGAAIGVFALMSSKIDKLTSQQRTLNEINKTAISNSIQQKVKIEQLYKVAQNEKNTLQQRKKAIDELNKISPEYFGNLDTENIKTEAGIKAKENYIKQLIKEAKVKAATSTLEKLGKKELEITLALEQANKDLVEARRIAAGAQTTSIRNGMILNTLGDGLVDKKIKLIKKLQEEKLEIKKTIQSVQDYIDAKISDTAATNNNSNAIVHLLPNLKKYGDAIGRIAAKIAAIKPPKIEKQFTDWDAYFDKLFPKLAEKKARVEELMNNLNQILNQGLQNLCMTFAEGIGNLMTGDADMGDFGKNILDSIGRFLKQMGQALIAYGILVKAFETTFLNPLAAIAIGTATIAAGQVLINLANKGPEMKNGGIVPPGFPGDTYPALLSSGETVLPAPIPLPANNNFNSGGEITVNVVGKISNETILLAAEKARVKLKRVRGY